ncbi:MAG: ABC transporter substrate-binding protein [Actinomycetota bacterium]
MSLVPEAGTARGPRPDPGRCRGRSTLAAVVAVSAMAAACSSGGDDAASATATAASVSAPSAGDAAASPDDATETSDEPEQAEPFTVTDAFGNDVLIPADPQRVFAGDDTSLANLLELGIVPVGTAVNQNAYPDFLGDRLDGIVDVSADNGFGVNIEALAALEPDLIIGPGTTVLQLQYDLAAQVAPTYAYHHGYASSDEIRTNLTDVARLFGLEESAAEIVQDLDDRVADLRTRLAESDRAEETVSVVRIFRDRSGISLRHGSTESVLMAEIGVRRPENQQSIEAFATDLSLETLQLADADTIYLYLDDPDDPAVYDDMQANALWQTLAAVRNDRVFVVDGGVWNGISITAAHLILDDLERTLGL